MIYLILFILLVLAVPFFPYFYFFLTNIFNIICYGCKDIFEYIKYKKYNNFTKYGRIVLYSASGTQVFGSGKTLSMIKQIRGIYKHYNGLKVYDFDSEQFVTQKIHIISNVELYDIPYIRFQNVNQFIDIDKFGFGPMDITIFVLDESGAIFNSRQFRDNIGTEMLTRLLQSRKNKCCLYMTSQRLQFTDKLLREILSNVVECRKIWRICFNKVFNAIDLEYALNPNIVKSTSLNIWFSKDKDYNSYNTYQLVEQLRKDYNPDDYLSTEEILVSYGEATHNKEVATNIKKKYR